MKFKYKIKIFKKNIKLNNKVIFGNLILNNNLINVYVLNNNLLNKFFKNNFLIVCYNNIKYYTFIKIVKYSPIKNKIEYFILEIIKKTFNIYYYNDNIKISKKITFLNNGLFPRKINLISFIKKKIITFKNFLFYNFKNKNIKLFYNKKVDKKFL